MRSSHSPGTFSGWDQNRADHEFLPELAKEAEMTGVYAQPMRRVRAMRLHTRSRVLLFLFVSFALVLVPWMTLYLSEGTGSNEDALILPGGPDDGDGSKDGIEKEGTEGGDRTRVVLVPSMTMTRPVSSSSLLEPTSIARPDLPVRELSQYVDPLIGTEGRGHGIFSLVSVWEA